MQRWPMHLASRCRARSKRSGKPCRSPAVRGSEVFRMHGAGGGAPRGNRNALKHGLYTAEAIETRRLVAAVTKQPASWSTTSRRGRDPRLPLPRAGPAPGCIGPYAEFPLSPAVTDA